MTCSTYIFYFSTHLIATAIHATVWQVSKLSLKNLISAHTIFYMTWFLLLQRVEISIKSLESASVKSKKHALFKSSCHPLKRSLYVQCFTAPCPVTIVPQFRLFVPNEHHSETWPWQSNPGAWTHGVQHQKMKENHEADLLMGIPADTNSMLLLLGGQEIKMLTCQ